MPTRGYNSYHGRRSLWKVLLVVLLVLVLTAAGAFLLLQDYIIYESDGSIRLELPMFRPDAETPAGGKDLPAGDTGGNGPGAGDGGDVLPPVVILEPELPEPEPAKPLQAAIVTAAALCDADADPLGVIRGAGRNGLVVEMKGDNGDRKSVV